MQLRAQARTHSNNLCILQKEAAEWSDSHAPGVAAAGCGAHDGVRCICSDFLNEKWRACYKKVSLTPVCSLIRSSVHVSVNFILIAIINGLFITKLGDNDVPFTNYRFKQFISNLKFCITTNQPITTF